MGKKGIHPTIPYMNVYCTYRQLSAVRDRVHEEGSYQGAWLSPRVRQASLEGCISQELCDMFSIHCFSTVWQFCKVRLLSHFVDGEMKAQQEVDFHHKPRGPEGPGR